MKKLLALLIIAPSFSFASGIYNPGSGAGGGSGGASALEVFVGATRSSPTASVSANPNQFAGTVSGSTFTFILNSSSVTLQGNSILLSTLNSSINTLNASFPVSLSTSVAGTLDISNSTNLTASGQATLSGDNVGVGPTSLSTGTVGTLDISAKTNLTASGNAVLSGSNIGVPRIVIGSGTVGAFDVTATSASATGSAGLYSTYNTSAGSITLRNVASGTQCLHADGSGNVTGTGADCGSGGGGGGDNLGSHIATMTVTADYGIHTSTITSAVFQVTTSSVSVNTTTGFLSTGPVTTGTLYQINGNPALWDGAVSFRKNTFVGNTGLLPGFGNASADTCVGGDSCSAITTGSFNTILGQNAAHAMNSGASNVVIGAGTGSAMTDDTQNVLIGQAAGQSMNHSSQNTVIGYNAGPALTVGQANVFLGYSAGDLATTGSNNVLLGQGAGADISTGDRNTCVGGGGTTQPCQGIKTGSANVYMGAGAGNVAQDAASSSNTVVGSLATTTPSVNINKSICIGYGCVVSSSSTAQIGGAYGSGNEVNVLITSASVQGTLTLSKINSGTQCLHADSTGLISGTGSDCSAGGGGGGSASTLAIATGTTTGWNGVAATSPTAVVNLDQSMFSATLQGGATSFVTLRRGISAVSANFTLASTSTVVLADASGGNVTVTLPTAVGITGKVFTVKRTSSGANTVTVATTSAQTIDGATTQVMTSQYTSIDVISDGANWSIL